MIVTPPDDCETGIKSRLLCWLFGDKADQFRVVWRSPVRFRDRFLVHDNPEATKQRGQLGHDKAVGVRGPPEGLHDEKTAGLQTAKYPRRDVCLGVLVPRMHVKRRHQVPSVRSEIVVIQIRDNRGDLDGLL